MSREFETQKISPASKPVISWTPKDGIKECRKTCDSQGYLKDNNGSSLGDFLNIIDAVGTYKGDLIQQLNSWLLKFWPLILKGVKITSPLHTVDFLNEAHQILTWKLSANSVEELMEPENILKTFQWLVCYLLKSSYENHKRVVEINKNFWAKNENQLFYAKNLAVAYVQHLILQKMYQKILEATDISNKSVLLKFVSLIGAWCLEKHVLTLYVGGCAVGPNVLALIQESILKLSGDLKDDADFVNFMFGYPDGQVYKYLKALIMDVPGAQSWPKWWKKIVNWKDNMHSKL